MGWLERLVRFPRRTKTYLSEAKLTFRKRANPHIKGYFVENIFSEIFHSLVDISGYVMQDVCMKTKTMQEKLTDSQIYVLGYMRHHNIGVLFSDVLQRWIWPSDIRLDKNLATGVIAEKSEIAAYVRRILAVQ